MWIYKLAQMMSGRYGIDRLFFVIFGISTVLSVANIFLRSLTVQIIMCCLMVFGIYRMFSRNISLREKENKFITGWADGLKKWRDTRRRRAADTTHIYKKCPKCRSVLRLPRRKGKHTTVCPKCNKQFKVNVRK